MKFGQSIEYNTKNIRFEKSCTKHNGKTSSRLFFNKPKLSISISVV